jgi:hypothetical protein
LALLLCRIWQGETLHPSIVLLGILPEQASNCDLFYNLVCNGRQIATLQPMALLAIIGITCSQWRRH